jgi:hypothetical protein
LPDEIANSQPSTPGQPPGSPPAGAGTPGASPTPSAPETPTPSTPPSEGAPPSDAERRQKGDAPAAPAEGAKDPPGDKPAEGDKPRDASGKFAADYSKLTFAEGFKPDEGALGQATALFAEAKLPPAQAQKLVDFYQAQVNEVFQAQARALVERDGQWKAEVENDPALGRSYLGDTNTAIDKLRQGMPTVATAMQVLHQHGLGNHPAVVRAFRDLGASFVEDRLVTPGAGARSSDPLRALYPSMFEGS